ncbi:hypothetical protein [Nocardia abscessus]|uniref:hypothetical protein n=1 Tax=Nocardia abscessus TaxID=120957 RepID=UPI0024577CA5|nr:hypothetical protein [Nocardia abscessus]
MISERIGIGVSLLDNSAFVVGPDGFAYTKAEYAAMLEDEAIDRALDLLEGRHDAAQ